MTARTDWWIIFGFLVWGFCNCKPALEAWRNQLADELAKGLK